MKQVFFSLPAVKKAPDNQGILFYWLPCKATPWGIMFGTLRFQWRNEKGWCFEVSNWF